MLFSNVVDAYVASRAWDAATLSRLQFWTACLGGREFTSINPDDVDDALVRLAERGRLKAGKRATVKSGQPLKPSTVNRYISTLQSVYKFARKARLTPRNFSPPTRGIEKHPEPVDPDRYLRVDEVERIITCARVIDRHWKRLPALIVLALHTGLRRSNLLALRWSQVDLQERRVIVGRTKNGEPIGAALTTRCVEELARLPGKDPAALLFGNRLGKPFHFGGLWARACAMAGLKGRNFHQLRHGCGTALAMSGASQAQVMAVLGHRTLSASRRYLHHNVADQQAIVDRVFG